MQSRVLKIVVGGVILFFARIPAILGQISGFRLQQADSLYIDKKYTQSLEHYKTILSQDQYTPAMLLKMAYIEEGLNHIGPALYYLNLYYVVSNDKTVLTKMEELATRYNLEGYENSDADQAFTFYRDYHFHITLALGVIAHIFCLARFFHQSKGQTSDRDRSFDRRHFDGIVCSRQPRRKNFFGCCRFFKYIFDARSVTGCRTR